MGLGGRAPTTARNNRFDMKVKRPVQIHLNI